MSDTPRTDAFLSSNAPIVAVKDFMRQLERELSIESAEKMKYRERAWHAESQLETRYGLRKEINTELGLTDETGDDALRKGLETIKALKAERDHIGSGRVYRAHITQSDGDVWLHVSAPNGNKGSLNLNKMTNGPITRRAFVDWAKSHLSNEVKP